ncbi:WD40-repeat-containing domain protein [Lipomyces oligophaga]|uniref:WD40-repeat-containing domain protein n=1 Tax=Lipomyces oligophaga TaxID=45792 RepID=UPI0034CEB2B4
MSMIDRDCLSKDAAKSYLNLSVTREYRESTRGAAGGSTNLVAWNPIGSLIAVSSASTLSPGKIRIWNPDRVDAKFSSELKGHSANISSIAWNPTTTEQLLSSSAADGAIVIWDVRSNKPEKIVRLTALEKPWIPGQAYNGITMTLGVDMSPFLAQFSPDGQSVVVVSKNRRILMLDISLQLKCPLVDINDDELGEITAFSIAYSGSFIVLAFSTGFVNFYQLYSDHIGDLIYSLAAHCASISCLAIDPRGKYLALGSSDSLVSIWDLSELTCKKTLAKSAHPVKSVAFSWDGAYLAVSADGNAPIDIIHLDSGDVVYSIQRSASFTSECVEWHPSRYSLAYSGDSTGFYILGRFSERNMRSSHR